jgi:hypothetical protein
MATVFEPIRPVPPMTTIFMVSPPLSMRRGISQTPPDLVVKFQCIDIAGVIL